VFLAELKGYQPQTTIEEIFQANQLVAEENRDRIIAEFERRQQVRRDLHQRKNQ
jgi:type III secretory pathway lipoprotein EscJ